MVEYKYSIIIIFFFMLFSQSKSIHNQLQLIRYHNPIIKETPTENLSFTIDETSEIKLSALWFIRFYQNFIGSQHDNHKMCTFVPSCSRFGVSAIKNHGIFKGILMTSDRIQRCNNMGNRKYAIDSLTNKRIDPAFQYQTIFDLNDN